MIFQDTPTPLDRIVLAVIGWIVRQPDCEGILLHERDEPLHKLGAPALILWAIIEINHQRREMSEPFVDSLPPLGETINEAITGHFGSDPVHKQLAQGWQEDAYGRYRRLGCEIVVASLDLDATLPTPGEGANFDGRFGIHGDAQDIVCHIGGVIGLGYLLEDGVGFWNFFCG